MRVAQNSQYIWIFIAEQVHSESKLTMTNSTVLESCIRTVECKMKTTQSVTFCPEVVGAVVLLVLPQVHFVLEAVKAARTAVGPLVPVFTAVGDEVGALAECFPTYVTHVGLLP